jgi:thiamine biosynthesis lipoprotein
MSTSVFGQGLIQQSRELKLMGTRMVITSTAESEAIAWKAIDAGIAEISRIERLISSWDESSQTSAINRNAGVKPVPVDAELYDLIFRAKKISELTEGAFDISFASMDRLYTFDGNENNLPDKAAIMKAKSLVNWKDIILNAEDHSIFLKNRGMKISFGAIGKGYAANQARKVMSAIEGVKGGIINASGDLSIWGMATADSETWNIKIANPKNIRQALAHLDVSNTSVVTSGDYEQFFTHKGKRYSHIIDPKTGLPTTGIKSATIICQDAELGDALATSMFVLGIENGIFLINQLKGIDAIVITDDDKIISTDHIKLNYN